MPSSELLRSEIGNQKTVVTHHTADESDVAEELAIRLHTGAIERTYVFEVTRHKATNGTIQQVRPDIVIANTALNEDVRAPLREIPAAVISVLADIDVGVEVSA